MAIKKKAQQNQGSSGYKVHSKKVVWIEALCMLLIWVLFIAGLGLVFYLRGPMDSFTVATNMVLAGILVLSIVPFLANWEYYSAIWAAWREGKEIIYKEPAKGAPYSVLGNREVWIKE
jgi:cation transport ATPase